ncbi:hypothetical protein DV735_g5606, partial [Chaetothyriales sp. CBS 134920]
MATKKTKTADDDLLAQLDDLGAQAAKASTKPVSRPARKGQAGQTEQAEQDLLAELGSLAQRPASRPATPSLKASPSALNTRSPVRTSTATPPSGASDDKAQPGAARKSNESTRSGGHQAFTPATTTTEGSVEHSEPGSSAAKSGGGGGGWWGGFTSIATAAVSQVQKAAAEIQKNEDAHKYFEQVRGNVANLRGLSGDIRALAAPTFQSLLHTIAPPISSHERLRIYITHDLKNYPSLDRSIQDVFGRVMMQVEGGELIVVQKGQENGPKRDSISGSRSLGGWQDGPWWRTTEPRSINAVSGLKEGTKLARVSAENYAHEHYAHRGGVEEAAKQAAESLSATNPTRESEIFLAIQAIGKTVEQDLFQGSTTESNEGGVIEKRDEKENEEIIFAVHLEDPVHGIAFSALSSAVPAQWIEWLDAPAVGEASLPDSIEQIIESGGVDPREWVSEWVESTIVLAVGIVAQRYVARRMGVGESGARKGKAVLRPGPENVVEAGGGEAARVVGGL